MLPPLSNYLGPGTPPPPPPPPPSSYAYDVTTGQCYFNVLSSLGELYFFSLAGRHIYVFGGKSYQKDKEITEVDYYHAKKRKWHTVFHLPTKYSYANLDCVKLSIVLKIGNFHSLISSCMTSGFCGESLNKI